MFDDLTFRRVQDSVTWTERQREARQFFLSRLPVVRSASELTAVASEDVEHNTTGQATLTTGSSMTSLTSSSGRTVNFFNAGPKIWEGSAIVLDIAGLTGSELQMPVASQAFSATRLVGTAASSIAANSSGTLTSVTALDGEPPGTSVSVYHSDNSAAAIVAGSLVWAELFWSSGSGASEWRVAGNRCCSSSTVYPGRVSSFSNLHSSDPDYTASRQRWPASSGSTWQAGASDPYIESGGVGSGAYAGAVWGKNKMPAVSCPSLDNLGNCQAATSAKVHERIGQMEFRLGSPIVSSSISWDSLIGASFSISIDFTATMTPLNYSPGMRGWGPVEPAFSGSSIPEQTQWSTYAPSWITIPSSGFHNTLGVTEPVGTKECKLKVYGVTGKQLSTASPGSAGYIARTASEYNSVLSGSQLASKVIDWDIADSLEDTDPYFRPAISSTDLQDLFDEIVNSSGFSGSDRVVLYFVCDSSVSDSDSIFLHAGQPAGASLSWTFSVSV